MIFYHDQNIVYHDQNIAYHDQNIVYLGQNLVKYYKNIIHHSQDTFHHGQNIVYHNQNVVVSYRLYIMFYHDQDIQNLEFCYRQLYDIMESMSDSVILCQGFCICVSSSKFFLNSCLEDLKYLYSRFGTKEHCKAN